jgi:dTDP-4-amino-4,6-dideoxygalactose transaminase
MSDEKFLLFHKPSLGGEEQNEVLDTLASGWLTTGPKTRAFEEKFATYIGRKHAIGVNSCTAAMHLSLIGLEIGSGDEVITTPITFPATANVIIHANATPVFVDVEEDTLNIDPAKIEERITAKTKAILPVHFAGHPCDMDSILDIAKRHGLYVIGDCAHAIESELDGKKVGRLGDTACFSFYATKNITTGEGGMVVTDNDELAEKMRILSLHGISKDAWKRYSSTGYKHWEIIYPGYKYNMYDIQAALGLHQLAKIEDFRKKRARYTCLYNDAFKGISEVITPVERQGVLHAYHLYVIRVKTEVLSADRDTIMNNLQLEGIGIGIHFRAVHLHQYYRETYGFKKGMLPNAERASDQVISLPLYPEMTEDDVSRVISAVEKVIGRYRLPFHV